MYLIRTVKIIHDIIHRADYIFLSEFFRFIGVFVQEEIVFDKETDKTTYEKSTQCSACIFIGEKPEKLNRQLLDPIVDENEYAELVNRMPNNTIFLYGDSDNSLEYDNDTRINRKLQEQYLHKIVNSILSQNCQKIEREQYRFDKLIPIFVNNRLFFHSINMQYYSKAKNLFGADQGNGEENPFVKAYNELNELREKEEFAGRMQAHYLYALLWTKMKANIRCDYMNEDLYFSAEKMLEECRSLIADYPDFSNAKVLLGLCYEPLKKKTKEAVTAFSDALPDIEKECYTSSIYYWMGKKFEVDGRFPDQMKNCYLRSYKRSVKFRSLFKLGIIARKEKKYGESIIFFDTILSKLMAKDAIEYTDPLELEYMQKAYLQKCLTYYEEKRYDKVKENLNLAKRARDKINSNKFFDILYGEDSSQYRDISLARVNIEQFETQLSDALGDGQV